MGELLGITGAIGSGKTTFAELLCNTTEDHAHYEVWHLVAEIATVFNQALKAELEYETTSDPIELANQILIWLPDAISEILHRDVTWSQLAIKKHDTLEHPELYQKLFTYFDAIRQNQKLPSATITHRNKEMFRPLLQWIGGYFVAKISKTIWYDELMRRIELHDANTSLVVISGVRYPSDASVVRAHNGKIVSISRPHATSQSADVTEVERSSIKPDIVVINNGLIAELQILAEKIIDDLAANNVKRRYEASA